MIEPKYIDTDHNGEPLTEEEQEWVDNNEIRLEPFLKKNWKTGDSRDAWKEWHHRIRDAHKSAEWRSVMDDRTDRKVCMIQITNQNREHWLRQIGRHGLHYRDIRYSRPYNGFSHKHFDTTKDDPDRLTYSAIAMNEDVLDTVEEAENEMSGYEKHETIGELLNFPKCCRDFFNEIWLDKRQIDPMYEIACNTSTAEAVDGDPETVKVTDVEPYLNPLFRYWNLGYVTHIPCSMDCEASIDIAKSRGELMSENGYKEEANKLWEWLQLPAVWTGHNGIAHVKNRHMIGSTGTSTYWSDKKVVWRRENDAGGSII